MPERLACTTEMSAIYLIHLPIPLPTYMTVSVAVSTQYANVTDIGQTPHDGIGRAYA